MASGWHNDSFRHSLAARGIKTAKYMKRKKPNRYFQTQSFSPTDLLGVDESGFVANPERTEELKAAERRANNATRQQVQRDIEVFGGAGEVGRGTLERRLKEGRSFRESVAQDVREQRLSNVALRNIERGDFQAAQALLSGNKADIDAILATNIPEAQKQELRRIRDEGLAPSERNAIVTALSAQALQQAQAGLPVSSQIKDVLDRSVVRQIEAVEQARAEETDRALESPLRAELREALPGAVAETVDAPIQGVKALLSNQDQTLNESLLSNIDDGIPGNTDDLADSPWVTANAFVGNEEAGFLNPLPGEVPPLSSAFNFVDDSAPGTNPVFMDVDQGRTFTQRVTDQVNQMYNDRRSLADVDLKPFDKGTEAFKKGNREDLIDAITELKSEESKLKDRFRLVNQVKSNVSSTQNFSESLKSRGDNALDWLGVGSSALVDQTKKINEVQEDLIKANNKAFSRRRMLEFRLQRLDATVPPETEVPETVKRFGGGKGGSGILGVKNPLFEGGFVNTQ